MPVIRFQSLFSKDRDRGNRRFGRVFLSSALSIPEYARLHYDIRHLSSVSTECAAEDIETGFIFHNFKSMTNDRDIFVAFQLHIPVAIRIYDAVAQRLQPIKIICNCIDYQSTQSACAHLYMSHYLIYTIFVLTYVMTFYTFECNVERRSAKKSTLNE